MFWGHQKKKKKKIFKEYFQFQPHTKDRSGNTGSMHIGNRRFHHARLRFVSPFQAPFCISTGTFVPSLLWHFHHHFFSVSFCYQWKSENNFNTASRKMVNAYTLQQKHKPHFELPRSVKTIQSLIQKPTLWQPEVARFTYVPLITKNTQNWANSGPENKWTAKHV